jgi:polyhydroxybutyrate depolymerase
MTPFPILSCWKRWCAWVIPAFVAVLTASEATAAANRLVERTWDVAGVTRTALISDLPAGPQKKPLVLVFHGHGGSARQAARSFKLHELWPAARVIYPDGLPTPGVLTDPTGRRSGWQAQAGSQGDRDLAFFDAILTSLREEGTLDPQQVYATGHSNGGAFVYLLWAERGETLTAIAPSAAVFRSEAAKFQPKPVLHLAGMKDDLVKFAWQERMLDTVLRINGGGPRQKSTPGEVRYTPAQPAKGAPTIVLLHPGGHTFPSESAARIVAFFQNQRL